MSNYPDFSKVETYNNGILVSSDDNRVLADVLSTYSDDVNNYREWWIDNTPMWFIGHPWAADTISKTNVTGAITTILVGVALPDNFVWRDENNINVPFTAKEMITLGSLMAAFVQIVYAASWEFKAQADACTSLAEYDALPPLALLPWPDGNMDGSMPVTLPVGFPTSWVGMPYVANVVVHGGTAPYTLSVSGGALPDGLALANNVLTGTPTAAETYTFTLAATDSTANTAMVGSQSYTFTVLSDD